MDDILVVDKPSGMTSHDVVKIVRKKLKVKKIGHCGTLDPMATGVLVLVMNKATKLSARLSADDKEYICSIRIGRITDTYDATGRVLKEKSIDAIEKENIRAAILSFRGRQKQVPPMVSAKHHNGMRLYALARKGIVVKRYAVDIEIKDIDILDIKDDEAVLGLSAQRAHI